LFALTLLAPFFPAEQASKVCTPVSLAPLVLVGAQAGMPVLRQTAGQRPPVVVVEGDYLGPDGAEMKAEAAKFAGNVRRALDAACVAYETSKDSTVEKWGLPQSRVVAVLPYNRAVSAGELAQIRAFLECGGKVIAFYVGPDELLQAVGVKPAEVVHPGRDGEFAGMAFGSRTLPALPDGILQTSWNVRKCEPLEGSVVIGDWVDTQGTDTGLPAAVLGERGAFISHVFAGGDEYRKGQLLRAIIGHFCPSIWPEAVRGELAEINAVGRFGTLPKLRDHLQSRKASGQRVEVPLASAERALELADAARGLLAQGDAPAAIEAATAARTAAARAFWATYPSKPGELRGAWMIYKGRPTWDETMRNLRAANLNAVMPRFCSAGVAYFPSQYLPQAPYVKEHGDQLAQACEAARKYGVPVHARMLALFVYEAPEGVREAYKQAGRLMVSTTGETESWLCPSNPLNRQAVVGACLEMARYPVAGIQLDYIRYPWKTYCYCKTCKAKFEQDMGVKVDQWPFDCSEGKYRGRFADWRREQITSLVREIRLRLKDANPSLMFSADVFVNWEGHRESFGQDWKAWVDEGLLDFACPMDYFGDDDTFTSWVTKQRQWTRWETPMCVGLGPRVEDVNLDPQHVLTQVELSRRLGGDGWVLFDYDETLASQHLPVVGAGVSSEPTEFTPGPPIVRCKATPTGKGARLEYRLDTRGDGAGAPSYGGGGEVGRPRLELPGVVVQSAQVSLYTADAWPVFDLGALPPDEAMTKEVDLAGGPYRLCAQGTCVRPGAQEEEQFVRWGPVFEVTGNG
jgi:uncharacterized lipoprotein YddW (UPF0748 family)